MKRKTNSPILMLGVLAAAGALMLGACGNAHRDGGAASAEHSAAGGTAPVNRTPVQDGLLRTELKRVDGPRGVLPDSQYGEDLQGKPDGRTENGEPYDMFFKQHGTNPFVDCEDDRLSTFAVDVDTGSYTVCRDYLNRGNLPPDEAPRVEEFVNYFKYKYESPRGEPFAIEMAMAPSRYGQDLKGCHLLRVGMQARTVDPLERKPANLTFVIDISGSMNMENRLGLVKKALKLLVGQLRETDRVGIAVYGDTAWSVLEHTGDKEAIERAINSLQSQGSTYAEAGIRLGYDMAAEAFRENAINRVILCSDGVANVGETKFEKILEYIANHRRKGITLSCIGFGMSNYNDTLMEGLGDKGDGHYAYVDTLDEARKIFVDNLTGTLQVVARDTKVQLEFNPKVVKSWRLLGYENRDVADEDFRNDAVDGGEVGSGHAVTALYEVKLYENVTGPVATATVRFKHDELKEFLETSRELTTADIRPWDEAPASLRLAGNAAEFAELLRRSYWAKGGSFDALADDLKKLVATSDDNDVLELLTLVNKARTLKQANATPAEAGGVAGGK